MTGTNDKLRGLFLAALMVASVFAMTVSFSGAVAAANQPVVDTSVEFNGNIEIAFNRSVQKTGGGALTGSDVTVWIGDSSYTPSSLASDGNTNGNLTIDSSTFENDRDIDPVETVKVNLPEIEAASGADTTRSAGNVSIDVTSQVVTQGNTPTSNTKDIADAFQGEVIAVQAATTGTSIQVREVDGSIQRTGSTATNGRFLVFDTSSLDIGGNYSFRYEGDATLKDYVRINDLQLTAEAQDTTLVTGVHDIKVDVSAVRGGENVKGVLLDSDGDPVGDSYNITKSLGSTSAETTMDFGTIDTEDDYTVVVTDFPSGVQATTDTIEVSERDADASFTESDYADNRGDVIEFGIELEDTDNATVKLGDYQDDGYQVNFSVEDGDDNGMVNVTWNTFMANNATTGSSYMSEISLEEDDDTLHFMTGGNPLWLNKSSDVGGPDHNDQSDIIQAGTYDLSVRPFYNSTTDASTDVATATVQERSTDAVNIWTAPGAIKGDLSSVSNVRDRLGVNVTQDGTIASGDLVVHEIQASGLEGALANVSGSNTNDTQDFLNIESSVKASPDSAAIKLASGQTNAQNNRDPKEWATIWEGSQYKALTVVADSANDTYFAVLDPSEARFSRDSGTNRHKLADGDALATNVSVFNYNIDDNNFGLVNENEDGDFAVEAVYGTWSFSDAEATVDTQRGGLVRVQPEDNQTVRGTTNVAAGSEVQVRVQTKEGASNAFLLPATVTVDEGNQTNTWSHEFDFSDRSVGTEFTVDVRRSGDSLLDNREDGIIQGEPTVSNLQFSDQDSTGNSVVVDSVTLSEGGFIALHQGGPGGDVIGNSGYLEAGEDHTNIAISLDPALSDSAELYAMPHKDTDNDQQYDFPDADGPYVADGSPVVEPAQISVGTETPPPTTAPPTTAPPTTAPPTTMATTEPPETTTPGQDGPGFGVVVALIALIAAALLAVRRND